MSVTVTTNVLQSHLRGMFFIFPLFRQWSHEFAMVFCKTFNDANKHANATNKNKLNLPKVISHAQKNSYKMVQQGSLANQISQFLV